MVYVIDTDNAGDISDIYPVISVGESYDNTAGQDVSEFSGDVLPMTISDQLINSVSVISINWTTFEGDGIPTNPTDGKIAPPYQGETNLEVGVWSDVISDANCAMDWSFVMQMNESHTSAITLMTDGPNITSGTVEFVDGDTITTESLTCTEGRATIKNQYTFSELRIHISSISEPYMHVRITELFFGAVIDFTKTDYASLSGSDAVTWVQEIDLTEQTNPLMEVDINLINVDGDYDYDNPDNRLERIAVGKFIFLNMQMGNVSVPCGQYVIASYDAIDNTVSVVAYDNRYPLQTVYEPWTAHAGASIATTFSTILNSYGVEHVIDTDVYDMVFSEDTEFDSKSSYFDDITALSQRYNLNFLAGRDCAEIRSSWGTEEHDPIKVNDVMSYPQLMDKITYNGVQISYENGSYTLDLRETASEASNFISITNDTIPDETTAITVAQRIAGRIWGNKMTADIVGDPTIDMRDKISIPTRWRSNPDAGEVVYREGRYNGLYTETIQRVFSAD